LNNNLLRQDLEDIYEKLIKHNRNKQVIVVNNSADKVIKEKAIQSDNVIHNKASIEGVNTFAGYDYFIEDGAESEWKCVVIDKGLYETLKSLPDAVDFWETIESMNRGE